MNEDERTFTLTLTRKQVGTLFYVLRERVRKNGLRIDARPEGDMKRREAEAVNSQLSEVLEKLKEAIAGTKGGRA